MRRRTASDDALIYAVARGDAAACAELLRRHRRWVVRLLVAFTRNQDEAEDLTQEVFTRMYRYSGTYRKPGSFIPWLRRIATNTGSTYLQQRAPLAMVPLEALENTPSTQTVDPLLGVLEQSLEDAIRAALAQLSHEQREAILLRCFLGMTVPEIARRQQCPEGTVKSRLSIGLGRVRTLLTPTGQPEERS